MYLFNKIFISISSMFCLCSFAYGETYTTTLPANQLLNPSGKVYDITFSDDAEDKSDEIIDKMLFEVDKVLVEVDSISKLIPRVYNSFECKNDSYNNEYCPEALATADEYWDYDDGYSQEIQTSKTSTTDKVTEYYSCNYSASSSTSTSSYSCNYNASATLRASSSSSNMNFASSSSSNMNFASSSSSNMNFASSSSSRGGGTSYTCPNGGTLSGTTCLKTCSSTTTIYSCPKGGTLSGKTCSKTCSRQVCPSGYEDKNTYTASATTSSGSLYCKLVAYGTIGVFENSCPQHETDYVNKRSYCYVKDYMKFNDGSCGVMSVSGSQWHGTLVNKGGTTSYSCPNGGTLSGTTCTLTSNICLTPSSTSDYSYYNYLCKDEPNEFTENWQSTETGGDLGKDATYSSTPPSKNCKRKEYTCNSNERTPAWVDNQWQCSPWSCNSDKKCGYAYCEDNELSTDNSNWMGRFYFDDFKTTNSDSCKDTMCNLTTKYISFCGDETCPQGFGVSEENNFCYKEECPENSYFDEDGKCYIVDCPENYTDIGDDKCQKQ